MPSPDRSERRTVVICIGNQNVADAAVGYEVFSRLEPTTARLEYCGMGVADLLPLLNGETELIVVDAVQLGAAPGTVHVLPWQAIPKIGDQLAPHGLGLRETIEIGRFLCPEQVPQRVMLVGVEGRCFDQGRDRMTAEVAEAIDAAVVIVQELVQGKRAFP